MSDGNSDREELARLIWSGDDEVIPSELNRAAEVKPEDQQQATPPAEKGTSLASSVEADPWAGLPSALRQEFEGMRAKISQTEALEMRVKQAERRLGTVQNELHAAKETAKTVASAPTAEQIAATAQTQKDWDEVKENFPELAKATESRLAAEREETRKLIPDTATVRRQIAEELDGARTEMAGNFVALKHPDWVDVRESKDFKEWNEKQGVRDSMNPIEVIAILDDYKQHKAVQKTPKQIEAERQQRLEQSQSTEGRNIKAPKSEADMSPVELRAHLAKQVWPS